MTTVQIGGVTFQGIATTGFVFQSLIDWYSVPDSKSDIRERPSSDGAFGIDRDLRQSLAVTLEGVYLGTDEVDAARAKLTLAGLGSGDLVTATVTDVLGTTTRQVSIRRISVADDFGRSQWTYALDMIAPDPRRYGPQTSVSTGMPTSGSGFVWPAVWPADWGTGGDPGRVNITNTGVVATYPVLEVRGGLGSGVELVETITGSYLRLERDIPDTSIVYFDTRTGRAYLDTPANDLGMFLTRREWSGFAIPAGSTRTVQFNGLGTVTGTPQLTARYAPAY